MMDFLKGLWRSFMFVVKHGDVKRALEERDRATAEADELREQLKTVQEKLATQHALTFEHAVFWTTEGGERGEPVCPTCYLDDEKAHTMTRTANGVLWCQRCGRRERDPDAKPQRPKRPRGRGRNWATDW